MIIKLAIHSKTVQQVPADVRGIINDSEESIILFMLVTFYKPV